METVVRWSPHSTADKQLFVLLDIRNSRVRLCKIDCLDDQAVRYSVLCERQKLPNYTAFDFSKNDRYVLGLGGQSGEATILQVDPAESATAPGILRSFPVRLQRRCNSLAFNINNHVVTALERVRADHSLYIYDVNSSSSAGYTEPLRKLALAEGLGSVKFFNRQPEMLLAGVQKQSIRIYDLRISSADVLQVSTRCVHNLAIDPLDENYFISAGPETEPTVVVWDRRKIKPATAVPAPDSLTSGAVLEIKAPVDNTHSCSIMSLRFSAIKRSCFSILSSSGEVRAFELAQHVNDRNTGLVDIQQAPHNPIGGTPWQAHTYARRTHTLSYPDWSPLCPRGRPRIVSCDFMTITDTRPDISLLSLDQTGQLATLKLHDIPCKLNVTALDQIWLWKDKPKQLKQTVHPNNTSADDLLALQNSAGLELEAEAVSPVQDLDSSLKDSKRNQFLRSLPSRDWHDKLLTLNFPDYVPLISDALGLLSISRRRCEEGYSLDAQKNQKIVANDSWLVYLWATVARLYELSTDDKMFHHNIDLAYLGVYAIWTEDFFRRNRRLEDLETKGEDLSDDTRVGDAIKLAVQRAGYPPFKGHPTSYPEKRQLCLALCGWEFSKEALRQKCQLLMANGHYYKAIVVAVMRGFKDLAQDLLRAAVHSKKLQNLGLGAVIACESVNDEQRELCAWMGEETDDLYLKALLAYFVSGDWKVVVNMSTLPLVDRIGCAVKYIDDLRLDDMIKSQTQIAIAAGAVEGLVLTGLNELAVDLFSNYIAKSNDLQTAVLALSFSSPVYVADHRFDLWRETYLMQMQHWRAFNERTVYLDLHSHRSTSRNGIRFGRTASRPITLRCNHCLSVLAPKPLREQLLKPASVVASSNITASDTVLMVSAAIYASNSPAARSGLLCPHCSRPMPHCGICGLLIGNPDPRRVAGAAANLLAKEDPLARQALYCLNCTHVFHANHARDWFARHKSCPVPDCPCMCGSLH